MIENITISNLLALVFAILLFSSCQNNEDQIPKIPDGQLIDVNKDGVNDFQVNYSYAIVNSPTSAEGIFCKFRILGDNEILSKEGQSFLFLRNTNEISIDVVEPFKWNSINAHLATFENHFDRWPDKWEIATDEIFNTYFIGIKLNNSNTTEIGWIEFEIEERTGDLNIIETMVL